MARTWTSIPDTDIDTDSPAKTGLMEDLRDNDQALRFALIGYAISETSTTSTGYVTLASRQLFIPNFPDITGDTRSHVVAFRVKVDAGTGSWKVTDNASATDSDETTTGSTSYTRAEVTLAVDSSWAGTTRTIDFKAKNSGVNATYLQIVNEITSRLSY